MKSLGEVVVALAQSVVPDVQAFLELYVQTSIYLVAALPFQFPLFFIFSPLRVSGGSEHMKVSEVN
jgi:hypothetical protein